MSRPVLALGVLVLLSTGVTSIVNGQIVEPDPSLIIEAMSTGQFVTKTLVLTNKTTTTLSWSVRLDDDVTPIARLSRAEDLAGVRILFASASEQRSNLILDLESRGAEVSTNLDLFTRELLNEYDIVWMRERGLSPSEDTTLRAWVRHGGSLLIEHWSPGHMSIPGINREEWTRGAHCDKESYAIYWPSRHPINSGVEKLKMLGFPMSFSANARPLATMYCIGYSPGYSAALSFYGVGRIVVIVDDAFQNDRIDVLDNRLFANNAFDWLSQGLDWMAAYPDNGFLFVGETATLTLNLDTWAKAGGNLQADLVIDNNHPRVATSSARVFLEVTEAPDITLSRSSIAYGNIFITDSRTIVVTVRNDGVVPLVVDRILFDDADFSTPITPLTIQPQDEYELPVTYVPTSPGTKVAAMSLITNDPDELLVQVPLQAVALEPPVIESSPLQIVGNTYSGKAVVEPLIIRNTGVSNLEWTARIEILPGSAGDAITVSPISGTVPGGGVDTAIVTLDTELQPAGIYAVEVIVETNVPTNPQIVVPAVIGVQSAPDVELSKKVFDYGTVFTGYSGTDTLVVKNLGSETLYVYGIRMGGSDYRPDATTFSVEPGEKREVAIRFAPSGEGPSIALATMTSNDPDESTDYLNLRGNGLDPPELAVSLDSIRGSVDQGELLAIPLHFSNVGKSDLVWNTTIDPIIVQSGDLTGKRFATRRSSRWGRVDQFVRGSGGEFTNELGSITWESLKDVDGLWLNDGAGPITSGEADVLAGWIDAGGGLVLEGSRDIDNFNEVLNRVGAGFALAPTAQVPKWITVTDVDPSNVTFAVSSLRLRNADAEIVLGGGSARSVARSTTGANVIAVSTVGLGRVVAVTGIALNDLHIGSADNFNFAKSVVRWLMAPPEWVVAEKRDAVVAAGGATDYTVMFRGRRVSPGNHNASLLLTSNDPTRPVVDIPVSLTVNAAPDIDVDLMAVEYPRIFAGYNIERRVLITNVGSLDLDLIGLSSDNSAFIPQDVGTTVLPGGTVVRTVTFAPSDSGSFSGVLTITSGDPHDPTVTIPLFGDALIAPEISTEPDSLKSDVVWPDLAAHEVVIRNGGGSALTWSVSEGSDWIVLSPASGTTPPGQEDTLGVKFQSVKSGPGHHIEQLRFWSNDPAQPRLVMEAVFDVEGIPIVSISDTTLDFGAVIIGPELSRTFDVFNIGNKELQISALVVDGPQYSVNVDSLIVPPDSSRTVSVALRAMSIGPANGTLTVYTDDAATPVVVIDLFGEVTNTPILSVEPLAIADTISVDSVSQYSVVVANHALSGLIPLQAHVSVDRPWLRVVDTLLTVVPQDSAGLGVIIDATGMIGGQYSGSVVITTNIPEEPPTTILVDVFVVGEPELVVSRTAVDFGVSYLGYSKPDSFAITNNGTDVLFVTAIESGNPEFEPSLTGFSIAPKDMTIVTVLHTPLIAGEASDTLRIVSNDALQEVVLTANSLPPPRINISPDSLLFSVAEDDTARSVVSIWNTGSSNLEWSAFERRFRSGDEGWSSGGTRVLWLGGEGFYGFEFWADFVADMSGRGFSFTERNGLITAELISGYDIVWLGAIETPLAPEERGAIVDWVRAGGSLMVEPKPEASFATADALMKDLGTGVTLEAGSYLVTLAGRVSSFSPHPTTHGLEQLQLTGVAGIISDVTLPSEILIRGFTGDILAAYCVVDNGLVFVNVVALLRNGSLPMFDNFQFARQSMQWLADVAWFGIDTRSGVIPPGGSSNMTLDIFGDNLLGNRRAYVSIESNDPKSPVVVVPVGVVSDSVTTGVEPTPVGALRYVLDAPVPNPFNPSTIVGYEIPTRAHVTIQIFSVDGSFVRTLVDKTHPPGRYDVRWAGRNESGAAVASGIYFYRMHTQQFTQTRKMLLLK